MSDCLLKILPFLNDTTSGKRTTAETARVRTLVIAIFGYFGWTTAQEIKDQKAKAAELIKSLDERQQQAIDALTKFKGAEAAIASDILSGIAPKLGQIANYGMKIAEFAGSQWDGMSHEDRIRNCLEEDDLKRRDSDLNPIRNSTKFKEFVAAL